MNTVTKEQLDKLEAVCAQYALENDIEFDFYTICPCSEEGDGPEPLETAYSVLFEVYDFDYKHDFNWLERMLSEAGIELDRDKLGHEPYTDEISGNGELRMEYATTNCAVYGFQLALKK
jgi:hypothetical protein